ncbi:PREDICTED: probable U3 small nucleolar RNA-associated protein 11, partial [Tinamus guttatus]|uniref:probable U3 small nucleolar RNA-associated protein 11 n=1 Tax=Tinamus guttatus TaxID=94827 RepID=UPI00052F2D21
MRRLRGQPGALSCRSRGRTGSRGDPRGVGYSRKALERNPDEFYFQMVRSNLQDGVHVVKQPKDEVTPEQAKVMRTQDLKYVEMKRVAEAKKIERLKSELHLLDAEGKQPNKHVFFFDTKKE